MEHAVWVHAKVQGVQGSTAIKTSNTKTKQNACARKDIAQSRVLVTPQQNARQTQEGHASSWVAQVHEEKPSAFLANACANRVAVFWAIQVLVVTNARRTVVARAHWLGANPQGVQWIVWPASACAKQAIAPSMEPATHTQESSRRSSQIPQNYQHLGRMMLRQKL